LVIGKSIRIDELGQIWLYLYVVIILRRDMKITLHQAKMAMEAAEDKAREIGVAISVVVVDEHGSLIAVNRMDKAIPISPRFAFAKAFTSAALGTPSEGLADYAKEGKPYFGVTTIFGGELTTIAGGMPIIKDDTVVGGIGVGGSMDVNQDVDCCKAAVAALSS
jgi:uncharacterized protein GlcG (DUF336 family)